MRISSLIIIISNFLLSSCTVKSVENNLSKNISGTKNPAQDSARFDVKRFEEKKGKYGPPNYKFTEDNKNIRQWSDTPERDSPDSLKHYTEEISKQWSPFIINRVFDYKGRLRAWVQTFRLEPINKSYEYDENGKVIKVTDYEEKFKHSFSDIRELLLKERGIDIYDVRQAIARRVYHKNPGSTEAYYDIHVRDKKDDEKDYKIVISDDTLEIKEYRN